MKVPADQDLGLTLGSSSLVKNEALLVCGSASLSFGL